MKIPPNIKKSNVSKSVVNSQQKNVSNYSYGGAVAGALGYHHSKVPSHLRGSLQFQKNNVFEKDLKRRNKLSLIHKSIDEM